MTRFYSFLLLFSATLGQINCQAVYLRLDDRPHLCVLTMAAQKSNSAVKFPSNTRSPEISSRNLSKRLVRNFKDRSYTHDSFAQTRNSRFFEILTSFHKMGAFRSNLFLRLCLVERFRVIVHRLFSLLNFLRNFWKKKKFLFFQDNM